MKKKYIWILLGSLILIGSLYFVYTLTNNPTAKNKDNQADNKILFYQTSDKQRPKVSILKKPFENIGTMKVSEKRSGLFEIQNKGNKPLQIFYGSTSCACTFGQIKNNENKSPVFGMHNNQDFFFQLAPKEKAQVEVIYKPYIMPVYGKVQRTAILKTNDPDKPELRFVIEAFVK